MYAWQQFCNLSESHLKLYYNMLSIDDFMSLIWGLPKIILSIIDQGCQKLPIFFKHAMKMFIYLYYIQY